METKAPAPPDSPAEDAQEPLVSIVLPTYNGSRYLPEAIESCLAQTYQHWELIIVDDCSTDESPQIIAEYTRQDPRVRSIRHQVNQKLPQALNTGHAAAKGRYLVWTSDDNRFLPSALQEMVSYLEAHPAVAMVYADCVLIDEDGQYAGPFPVRPPSTLAYFNSVGACFMYRETVYQAVGQYDSGVFLAEDYDYWLRIYRRFEMAALPKVLYEYRSHGSSLSTSFRASAVRASVESTLRRHLPHLRGCSPEELARGWMVCAGAAARRGALLQATDAFARALQIAPFFSIRHLAQRFWREVVPARLPQRRAEQPAQHHSWN